MQTQEKILLVMREKEIERIKRLLKYIKAEIIELRIDDRLDMTVDLFNYLEPEIKALINQSRIKPLN